MEQEIYINGDLRYALLTGASIVRYRQAADKWYVLCRNTPSELERTGSRFTEYATDDMEIFRAIRLTSGSMPVVVRFFDKKVQRIAGEIL